MPLTLYARQGQLSTPDGASLTFYGFSSDPEAPAQLPGPLLVFTEGETIAIEVYNELPEPISLLFPGQTLLDHNHPVYQNGKPISLTDLVMPGYSLTYHLRADHPGTFLYYSGTGWPQQLLLGLHGMIIVRPRDFNPQDPATWTAYGAGTNTEFQREYFLTLSEVDPFYNEAYFNGQTVTHRHFKPRYWLMNGRCAHDTMMPDGVGYLPHQPFSSLIMAEPDEKVLLRYAGTGLDIYPLHPHGHHTRIIAKDGRLLRNGSTDLSYWHFTVPVCSGQTWDVIYEWKGLGYDPVFKPIPTPLPHPRNQAVGEAGWTMWSGSPYLGHKGEIPVGVTSFNLKGEYYFMLHAHKEFQITNWGEFPGGLMTMIGIFPPGSLPSTMRVNQVQAEME